MPTPTRITCVVCDKKKKAQAKNWIILDITYDHGHYHFDYCSRECVATWANLKA